MGQDTSVIILSELPEGAIAQIHSVETDRVLRDRLYDLGILPGTQLRCALKGAGGTPTAYCFRGTTIALRASDAAKIFVQPLPFSLPQARTCLHATEGPGRPLRIFVHQLSTMRSRLNAVLYRRARRQPQRW